jgi:hypothetical protein
MAFDYKYATFDPRPAGEDANNSIFEDGRYVIGIEVTIPILAERCALNLDHHGQDSGKPPAIVQALDYLVPYKATLATVRPDLDSVGAMAVLSMRRMASDISPCDTEEKGQFYRKTGLGLNESSRTAKPIYGFEFKRRLTTVADADVAALAASSDWQPRELPSTENPWPDAAAAGDREDLAAMAAAVSDFRVPLEGRVDWMTQWLCFGTEPSGYREKVEDERHSMIKALENGSIEYCNKNGVALVISTHRAATTVGYSVAPIVIALNPEFRIGDGDPHAKFTICQWKAGYVDLAAVWAELSELESGWGGTATIGGSPQGVSSSLSIDKVLEVVNRHRL